MSKTKTAGVETVSERMAQRRAAMAGPPPIEGVAVGDLVLFHSLNGSRKAAGFVEYPALVCAIDAETSRPILTLFPPFRGPVAMASPTRHETEFDDLRNAPECWTLLPPKAEQEPLDETGEAPQA